MALASVLMLGACGGCGGGGSTTPTAATPTLTTAATVVYPNTESVTISDGTSGAVIHYTTDGTTPTATSSTYSSALTISTSTTVKAIAVATGYNNSDVASTTYAINAPAPTFSIAAGTYTSVQSVTLSDALSGAAIYYTTDGSTPSSSSTKYTGAISVSASETVTAIAIASGYGNSATAAEAFTINLPTVATPVLSTPASVVYPGTQSVTITDSTSGAAIYYTTDGTTPSSASTAYSGAFSLAKNATVQAIAVESGYNSSSVASQSYVVNAPAPTFSIAAGTYTSVQSVTLSDALSSAAIYYTTDGTTPTSSSTKYTGAISVSASETITAIAIASGYGNSATAAEAFTINLPAAATPVISLASGTYTSVQSTTITDSTSGATIYYTTDGSTPTAASTQYTGAIAINGSETLRAIAIASGYSNSAVAQAAYTLNLSVTTPVISVATGTYTATQSVTISDAESSATIYYTTDGTTPSKSSAKYDGAITVATSETLSAIAIDSGGTASAVATATYTIKPAVNSAGYSFNRVQIVAGGFTTGIVAHPAQQGLFYLRTDMGGAYRWSSTSARWIPLTDWVTPDNWTYTGIESIAIDPNDVNKVYLAVGTYTNSWSGNGAILISGDQGSTFTTVPLSFKNGGNMDGREAGERLKVDPNNGHVLYFGSRNNGLWRSIDAGLTWTQVTTFPVTSTTDGVGIAFVDFVKSDGTTTLSSTTVSKVIYAGVSDDGTNFASLYRSTDGGASWSKVSGGPTGYFVNHGVFSPDEASLYLSYGNAIGPNGMSTGVVYKYTPSTSDASAAGTWTNITPPAPTFGENGSYGFGTVAVDAQTGALEVPSMDLWWMHDDIWRSTDQGASWHEVIMNGNTYDTTASPYISIMQTESTTPPGPGWWIGALIIDPFDSDHVMYGTGATVWATHNQTNSDSSTATAWTTAEAVGIEENAATQLVSLPTGTANLLSGVGDNCGFKHTTLTASPAASYKFQNPGCTTTSSLNFAQNVPLDLVRAGYSTSPYGGYSTDGGSSWSPFTTLSATSTGAGSVAISANATYVVWSPSDAATYYSKNFGQSWTISSGGPTSKQIVADRVNDKKFYAYDNGNGIVYLSTDGGATFANSGLSGLPNDGGATLYASSAAEGDLWAATSSGLYHSTGGGAFASVSSSVTKASALGFGKAATGASYQALYMIGTVSGTSAIYRSIDGGTTWTAITDATHQYSTADVITGDPNLYGRVYIGSNGLGIIYGDSTN